MIGSRYKIKALEQPNSPKLSLAIGDELISSVTNTKYMGLQVDQYFNRDLIFLYLIPLSKVSYVQLKIAAKRY